MKRICKMKNPDCTVLVCSCDKYADLLGPFSKLWRKFWPDCPFEVVLVTETAPTTPDLCFDRVVACGKGDTNWASRLECALDGVSTPWVLMLCDDYYLEAPVDTPKMLSRLEEAKFRNAANLRLIPNPPRGLPVSDDLMEYRKNTAYCVATQAGFWQRDFLARLAVGKSSIWEFERHGSFEVADEPRPILATRKREFPFVDAVHKGCWETFGVDVCRRNGVEIDFSRRGLPSPRTRLVEWFKRLVFAIFPHTLIVRVQNALGVGARERR